MPRREESPGAYRRRRFDDTPAPPGSTAGKAPRDRKRKGPGRKRPALPVFVEPQLATLVDEVPQGRDWVFEIKLDGYRALAAACGGDVRIYTRSGLDWTDRFSAVAAALAKLDLPGVLLDGEVVAVDEQGRSDFSALQAALKDGGAMSYFVFDLLEASGRSLQEEPLTARKERLQALLGDAGRTGPVYHTDHVAGGGEQMLSELCRRHFEGLIAKRGDLPYRSGRGRSWLKVKCGREQEFVIAGWSPSQRGRSFSSLILGLHEDGRLRYAGRVGTGFSEADLQALSATLRQLEQDRPPLDVPSSVARKARWVRPVLVAQIGFAGFTGDGLVRQGRFHGLREDKPAAAVVREEARPAKEVEQVAGRRKTSGIPDGVRLTHPDKVLFPKQGITKRELAEYLYVAAEPMLAHAARRLISLVRCPQGRAKHCFFQRHGGAGLSDAFRRLPVKEKAGGSEEYIYIVDRDGLMAAAQMGVLEFHLWGSHVDRVDYPDRLVFDLDPGPGVEFAEVRQAAGEIRDALAALRLESFPLLTGGKGIHVVAPMERRHPWPVVKSFARALAERFAAEDPDRYVATMTKARRNGRIFIDYLRNDLTASAIAPYSPRAREGAPVAWPVTWRELARAPSANCMSLRTAMQHLPRHDPWSGYFDLRQPLRTPSLRALGIS